MIHLQMLLQHMHLNDAIELLAAHEAVRNLDATTSDRQAVIETSPPSGMVVSARDTEPVPTSPTIPAPTQRCPALESLETFGEAA